MYISSAGIICSRGQILRAPIVICSSAYAGRELLENSRDIAGAHAWLQAGYWSHGFSRCVCITSGPVVDEEVGLMNQLRHIYTLSLSLSLSPSL